MFKLIVWCLLLSCIGIAVKADMIDEIYKVEDNSQTIIFSLDSPQNSFGETYESKFIVPHDSINFVGVIAVYNKNLRKFENKYQVYFSNNFYSLFVSKEDAKIVLEAIGKFGFSKKKLTSVLD